METTKLAWALQACPAGVVHVGAAVTGGYITVTGVRRREAGNRATLDADARRAGTISEEDIP